MCGLQISWIKASKICRGQKKGFNFQISKDLRHYKNGKEEETHEVLCMFSPDDRSRRKISFSFH